MSLLQNVRVYLAGPVEKENNDGAEWRKEISPFLSDLGMIVWDPLVKPKWFNDTCGCIYDGPKQKKDFKCLTNNPKTYEEFETRKAAYHRNYSVRETCLRLASSCDLVICKVGGKTVGTFEEIFVANQQQKPIIFLYEDGIDSSWRIIQFEKAMHFDSINEVIGFLKNVSKNELEVDNNQWIFLPERWPNAGKTSS